MDDKSLDEHGKLIRWIETPPCIKCPYRNHFEDRCRLQRCRWVSKRAGKIIVVHQTRQSQAGT
jgi:hypothetical protein